jgi:hypothetical protein
MDHERLEQHDRMIADHDRAMAENRERHDREIESIRQILRRAVRLAVREAGNEGARRRRAIAEIDGRITQLAAAQLITEEKFQRMIERDERRYGGNGTPSSTG